MISDKDVDSGVFREYPSYLGFSSASGSLRPSPTGLFSASSPVRRCNSASTFPWKDFKKKQSHSLQGFRLQISLMMLQVSVTLTRTWASSRRATIRDDSINNQLKWETQSTVHSLIHSVQFLMFQYISHNQHFDLLAFIYCDPPWVQIHLLHFWPQMATSLWSSSV